MTPNLANRSDSEVQKLTDVGTYATMAHEQATTGDELGPDAVIETHDALRRFFSGRGEDWTDFLTTDDPDGPIAAARKYQRGLRRVMAAIRDAIQQQETPRSETN